jgi:hypothetical protein
VRSATNATTAGSACTYRIFLLAVTAPNTPAAMTQSRKKITTPRPAEPSVSPQNRPAERKPL